MPAKAVSATAVFISILAACGDLRPIPKLTPEIAERALSSAPEFSRGRRLVTIAADSTAPLSVRGFGLARFTFKNTAEGSSQEPIEGTAQFSYKDGKWTVLFFRYGKPPNEVALDVNIPVR
jgi:hypothetical protein